MKAVCNDKYCSCGTARKYEVTLTVKIDTYGYGEEDAKKRAKAMFASTGVVSKPIRATIK